jgi:hypothetical protein
MISLTTYRVVPLSAAPEQKVETFPAHPKPVQTVVLGVPNTVPRTVKLKSFHTPFTVNALKV